MPIPDVDPTADSVFRRVGAKLTSGPVAKSVIRRVMPRIDPPLLRLSRGRVSSGFVTPMLLLHTIGAKSGQRRTTPLTYFTDAGRVVLIASNYGGTKHPAWYHNVMANPRVTLSAGGYGGTFVGQEATGEERERLWALATGFIATYAKYAKTTDGRTIPVLVFTETDS